MIQLNEVSLHLGNTDRSSSVHFHLPFLEVKTGEELALTGPSGCGKSTLLNLIAGLRQADKGKVEVAGVNLGMLHPAQLDRHRGTHCGMVFQSFHLLAPFTALENVCIGLRFGARKGSNRKERATEVLHRVGLGERLHARPTDFRWVSGNGSRLPEPLPAVPPSYLRTNRPVPSTLKLAGRFSPSSGRSQRRMGGL